MSVDTLVVPTGMESSDGPRPLCMATDAMGTRFELVLYGADAVALRAAGEAAIDVIHGWDRRLNWFMPGSLLSHINASAFEHPVVLDGEIHRLLCDCRRVWRDSGGAFDVTVGPLMVAWGFRGLPAGDVRTCELARASVGMDGVEIGMDPPSVRFTRPGTSLDFGSIAKGAALDAAAAVLRDGGVASALVHGGTSSVAAIGAPPGRDSWAVAIETGKGSRPVVELRDTSLSVSAPRGRTVMTGSGPAGHIIDPRTGVPAARVGTAVVVHRCGAMADAWSTALLVLGERPATMPREIVSILDLQSPHETAA